MSERKVLVTIPAGGKFWGFLYDEERRQWYARIDHPIRAGDLISTPINTQEGAPHGE